LRRVQLDVSSGVLLSERKDGIEKRPGMPRIEIKRPPRKGRYYFEKGNQYVRGFRRVVRR
jgi:hypothetical protein